MTILIKPVLYLRPDLSIQAMSWIIARRSRPHNANMQGELLPKYGYKIWKGQEYEPLPASHLDYMTQPWEKEAEELHPILLEHLKSKAFSPDK